MTNLNLIGAEINEKPCTIFSRIPKKHPRLKRAKLKPAWGANPSSRHQCPDSDEVLGRSARKAVPRRFSRAGSNPAVRLFLIWARELKSDAGD